MKKLLSSDHNHGIVNNTNNNANNTAITTAEQTQVTFEYPYGDFLPEEPKRMEDALRFAVEMQWQYRKAQKLAAENGMDFSDNEKLRDQFKIKLEKLHDVIKKSSAALFLSKDGFPHNPNDIEENYVKLNAHYRKQIKDNSANEANAIKAITLITNAKELLLSPNTKEVLNNINLYALEWDNNVNQPKEDPYKESKTWAQWGTRSDFLKQNATDLDFEEVIDPKEKKDSLDAEQKTVDTDTDNTKSHEPNFVIVDTPEDESNKEEQKAEAISDSKIGEEQTTNKKKNKKKSKKKSKTYEPNFIMEDSPEDEAKNNEKEEEEDVKAEAASDNNTYKQQTKTTNTNANKNTTKANNAKTNTNSSTKRAKKKSNATHFSDAAGGEYVDFEEVSSTNSTNQKAKDTDSQTTKQRANTTKTNVDNSVDNLSDDMVKKEVARIMALAEERFSKKDIPRSAIRNEALALARLENAIAEAATTGESQIQKAVAEKVASQLHTLLENIDAAAMTRAWKHKNTIATNFTITVCNLTDDLRGSFANHDETLANNYRKLIAHAPFESFTDNETNVANLSQLIDTIANNTAMETYHKLRCYMITERGLFNVDVNEPNQDTLFGSYMRLADLRWTEWKTINEDAAKKRVARLFKEMKRRANNGASLYKNHMEAFANKHNLSDQEKLDLFGAQQAMSDMAEGEPKYMHIKKTKNGDKESRILSLQQDEFATSRREVGEIIQDSPNFFYCKPLKGNTNEIIVVSKATGKVVAPHLTKHGYQKDLDTKDHGLLLVSKAGDTNAMSVITSEWKEILPFAFTSINVVKNTAKPENSLIVAKDQDGEISVFDLKGNTYLKGKNITNVAYKPGRGYELQAKGFWAKITKGEATTYYLNDDLQFMKKWADGQLRKTWVGGNPANQTMMGRVTTEVKNFFKQWFADLAEYPSLVKQAYKDMSGERAPAEEDDAPTKESKPQQEKAKEPIPVIVEDAEPTPQKTKQPEKKKEEEKKPKAKQDDNKSKEKTEKKEKTEAVLTYKWDNITIGSHTIDSTKIIRSDLKKLSNVGFVFGDNLTRKWTGGQAWEMRGEPNALGVATLHEPGKPFKDDTLKQNKENIDKDFDKIRDYIKSWKPVVFPKDWVGTWIADLAKNAPKTLEYINKKIDQAKKHMQDKGMIKQTATA